MPTNLPPEYFEAEKKFKGSETLEEKITSLEELLGTIPKHKGTDKLRADLRKKLSKLKESAHSRKKTPVHESFFMIKKEGAGQVVLTGPVNTGKSSLLGALTHANPEISSQPHTTWKPTPGMMTYQDISVQLIDTPPLTKEFVRPELVDLLKRADLLALTIDLEADPMGQISEALDILREKKIEPVDEFFIDNSHRSKFILVVNKHDGEEFAEDYEIFLKLSDCPFESVPVSANTGWNLDFLKRRIFEKLEVVRVYSKKPGVHADMKTPFVLKRGSTIEDFALCVHQDFKKNLKAAKVWGEGVFDGQMVHRDHILSDGDVVELHT